MVFVLDGRCWILLISIALSTLYTKTTAYIIHTHAFIHIVLLVCYYTLLYVLFIISFQVTG